ncbi:pirin family protein [Jannaschia sp. R86511]|uniref:pirin family protein n=1 Tax=Jannaschia sp. R86511 TaxID=3093853 RepID=UPI0036D20D67
MSNLEGDPTETEVGGRARSSAPTDGPQVQLLPAREVPLGGPRAMLVRRSLPSRARTTVGAWCFVDSYGPAAGADVMVVPPHPHTGLQTVTWLVGGEALHDDSVGSQVRIRPGQLNLMTSGHGIAHGERSLAGDGAPLHGVQLWVALPEAHRHQTPHFEHHADLPRREVDGGRRTVLLGSHDGMTSPAATYSPIVGVEVRAGVGEVRLPVRADFEHAVLLVSGRVEVAGEHPDPGDLVHLGTGRDEVGLSVVEPAVLLLLGGEPFGEELVMWWNFVGRSHDEVVAAREAWQDQDKRFGEVPGWAEDSWLRAPELPNVRLRPRRR